MRELYPDAAERVVLTPSRKKWALVLLLSSAFTAAGVWMIVDGDATGWLVSVFFGLCLVVSLLMLMRMMRLVLAPDGFTLRTPIRSVTYSWSDVTGFSPSAAGATTQVGFEFRPEYERHDRLRAVNRALGWPEAALGDTFGLDADELADVMNAWRARYGKTPE